MQSGTVEQENIINNCYICVTFIVVLVFVIVP